MSGSFRNPPAWVTNATVEAETSMLARLEAGAALMRLIIQASADNMRAERAALYADQGETPPTMPPELQTRTDDVLPPTIEAAPLPGAKTESKPAQPPRKRARRYMPRIHAPEMMALGMRASELLVELAPMIREKTVELIRAGIDPRQTILRAASMQVAQVFLDELGIDLENLDRATHRQIMDAIKVVRGWVRDCKRGVITPLAPKEAGDAGPSLKEKVANLVEEVLDPKPEVSPEEQQRQMIANATAILMKYRHHSAN